jgi:uncharacterized iron-regulated protein
MKTGKITLLFFIAALSFSIPGVKAQSHWYDHYKIYSSQTRQVISVDQLVASLGDADVIFFGEEHNDSIAHRLQDTIYRSLLAHYTSVTLSLEMFERDCQQVLDEYLQNFITDERLVKEGRAWSNYKDYRPMVNAAKQWQQPVIAANAPRRYVNMISRLGLQSLNNLPKQSMRNFARLPLDTLNQAYFEKFSGVMGGHSINRNVYYAQTLWDATMAESIYRYWKKNKGKKIFHLNGRFHTDYRLGTFTQLARRNARLNIRNISCFAADDFSSPDWGQYASLGDFVIVTDPAVAKSF